MDNDTYSKALSRNLQTIRRSKGLNTVDLAKILGVSQAKISYMENCKGILSARDVAILARKLDVPITEFFVGLDKVEDISPSQVVAGQLAAYGATLLIKPQVTPIKEVPFEEVFSQSLGFIEDDRLNKGFCAALITQAAKTEINVDRIFALVGNNPFLVKRVLEKVYDSLTIIEILNREKRIIGPRAKRQLEKVLSVAKELWGNRESVRGSGKDEMSAFAEFVLECFHAKR